MERLEIEWVISLVDFLLRRAMGCLKLASDVIFILCDEDLSVETKHP